MTASGEIVMALNNQRLRGSVPDQRQRQPADAGSDGAMWASPSTLGWSLSSGIYSASVVVRECSPTSTVLTVTRAFGPHTSAGGRANTLPKLKPRS